MAERRKSLDRLHDLDRRLRIASLDEIPSIERETKKAFEEMRNETDELASLAKQVVLRRAEIKAGLIHELAEIERQCQKLPGLPENLLVAEISELRERCEKMLGLVQEWR